MRPKSAFTRFAQAASRAAGRPLAFLLAAGLIAVWALLGPLFGFSDAWQLTVNTLTTIVTFLMVFLIQNTQYRDTEAMQIKLDELVRASAEAHNALLSLEELDDKDLDQIRARYLALARQAREALGAGAADTGTPSVEVQTWEGEGGNPGAPEGAGNRDSRDAAPDHRPALR